MSWNPLAYWLDWWRSRTLAERVVVVIFTGGVIGLLFVTIASAEPAQTVRIFVPIDIVALTQAVFTGIAAVGGVFATIYSLLAAARAKRAETLATANTAALSKVSDTVSLVERNTNSISTRNEQIAKALGVEEGVKKQKLISEEIAKTLLDGQQQGGATERASVAATAAIPTEPKP